jgi:acetoacetyl-CoA synthetase
MFPRPSFFPGAKLNFAENLLFPRSVTSEESPAIFAATELGRETVSWKDLRDRVRRCAAAMKAMNVKANDRVAGLIGNHVDALVIMLSATSLGAIWTGVSPDTGAQAVLDRLQQIEPVLLFVDNATLYNGKIHDMLEKGQMVANKLSKLQATIILKTVKEHSDEIDSASWKGKTYKFEDFEATGDPRARLDFSQLPPDHPVYILYSSGTTGSRCHRFVDVPQP